MEMRWELNICCEQDNVKMNYHRLTDVNRITIARYFEVRKHIISTPLKKM